MLFGDPLKFAVECTVDEPHSAWVRGHFCYRISGRIVGDFDMSVLLGDLLHPLAVIVKDNGKRQGESLCGGLDDPLFRALHASMYGNEAPSEESEYEAIFPDRRAKFSFVPDAEPFGGWIGYLIQCGSIDTLAFWRVDEENISYVTLETGEVDRVLSAAFHNLDQALSGSS